jgi:hypothetical protein
MYVLTTGSFANITCAAAVAASSFGMEVTDPKSLLDLIDQEKFNSMRSHPLKQENLPAPIFVEPVPMPDDAPTAETFKLLGNDTLPKKISGRIQRFGDNIDTDTVQVWLNPSDDRLSLQNAVSNRIWDVLHSITKSQNSTTWLKQDLAFLLPVSHSDVAPPANKHPNVLSKQA